MAYVNTTKLSDSIRDQADRFFARIGQGFNAWLELRSRREQIEKLFALSDTELAARGLKRDEIVQYVFRDRLHY
jgi:uncharacterized protein YjiS (DUF1127 family)